MPPVSPDQPLEEALVPGGDGAGLTGEDRSLKWYAAREPLVLVILTLLAVLSFSAVAGLSRIYQRQQELLGQRWYDRGVTALRGGDPEQALGSFHAALRYSRDNYDYQLSLAQALAALNRTEEAKAYLLNLWERQPENGTVNLELGRVFAKEGDTDRALRYYHNSIYATWPDHPDDRRRAARLELINFLLQENAKPQAQAELIALAANLPGNSPLHSQVGALFLQVEDYEHALVQFRDVLNTDRHNAAALAGAGRAAVQLGRDQEAVQYLAAAVARNPGDAQSAQLLQTASLVLNLDPFRRQVSASERNRRVSEAFATAGARLKSCGAPTQPEAAGASKADTLQSRWNELKPRVTSRGLAQNPDLADSAMDLVFMIERQTDVQTDAQCGAPTVKDQALLLIAKLHGGN